VIALVREVSPALAACELSFIDRQSIDGARAGAQHAAYCDALARAGAAVTWIAPAPEHPDGVFVEDAALVLDELAIITRPGADSRRGEVTTVAAALAAHRPLSFIREPATIDGGDVMRAGRDLFVGITARTNRDGFDQLTAIASRFGYRTTAVRVSGCLHLKTAVTSLDDDTLVLHRAYVDAAVFGGRRILEAREPSGGDVLSVNGTVLVLASAPAMRDVIAAAGYRTEAIDLSEFEKAEAGVTCLSLLVSLIGV
jgi:dimethylargininase